MNVAIIPARGGSKRIPRKNIKMFCGKPMIAWSIEAAIESGCFSRIIVSTDDDDIADVARDAGAEVPFRRPADLADDHAGTVPVIAHAVDWLIQHDVAPDFVCCIYATAPFITPMLLKDGLAALNSEHADYAFSVTTFDYPIQRALRVNERNRIEMFQPANANVRSQDLEEAWHDAGQFYWGRARAWHNQAPLLHQQAVPIPLPRSQVQDIDTPDDWRRAERLFRAGRS